MDRSRTRDLVDFAAQLRYADLPPAVIAKAKEIALHAWAVQLAGSTLPWSKKVFGVVRGEGGAPHSTVLSYGLRTSSAGAAFANGAFGHAFEMDDNHGPSSIKGGCVVLPAALAIGEREHRSGEDLIAAIVAGYEVMLRIALSVTPVLLRRGHHPTGTCGAFGAGMAASRLMHLTHAQMLHMIAVAAVQGSGLTEAPASGRGEVKRLFGGMAAASGIRAALLAQAGLTGPATMLEGEEGFCRAYGDAANPAALDAGLGTQWHILDVHYKIYAQDGYIQPMTEALARIVERHRFPLEAIEEVRAGCCRFAHEHVVGLIREPTDLASAQYSANFSLALFLVKGGAGLPEYTEDSLADPRILALSRRIGTEVDDEIEREWQASRPRGARVSVRLRSGETLTECVHHLRAMMPKDMEEKVRSLATLGVGATKAAQLMAAVRELEAVDDVATLVPLLTR